MPAPTDARARVIFDQVIDLPGEQRAQTLRDACAGDAALQARVEALLAAAETDDGFLNGPTLGDTPAAPPIGEQPGDHIGPYRLLEHIGEGGFGAVFMAEQSHPVRRRGALKIVKLGMDNRTGVARFEQERQALAMMDHPNIARVFDAGATDAGRPYFVMELVRGDPITQYCDNARLSIRERHDLFTQVCRAVQHAHTKGVIHRDLKPGNILVSTSDGRPSAKVIDFGIAKATGPRLTDKPLFTAFRQFIGTPEYMSPEQAAGSLDIDTRTDIYALGVLLYELLTGTTPFDGRQLRSAAWNEMQRIIREVDPPTPSTRLTRVESLPSVAATRRTTPQRLGAIIRGELDWIVMRTLDKDRARRYDSAGDLAADIERFLEGKPVLAAPASASYRFRKAVRRNRVAVITGSLVAAALLTGSAVALWQARVAAAERDAAKTAATEAEAARKEAEKRRQEIEQVAQFESARLSQINPPEMGRGMLTTLADDARQGMTRRNLPAEQIEQRLAQLQDLLQDVNATNLALRVLDDNILNAAITAVDEQFAEQPAVRARILHTLGGTMLDLGLLDRAEQALAKAIEIRRQHLGPTHADTLTVLNDFGMLRFMQTRLRDAEQFMHEAYEGRETTLGPNDESTLISLNNLGLAILMQGRTAEAEPIFRKLLDRFTQTLGPDHPYTIQTHNSIGGMYMESERPAKAEPHFRQALAGLAAHYGQDHDRVLLAKSNLAFSLERQDKLDEAEALYRDAAERASRALGDEHPQALLIRSNLGYLLCSLDRLEESERIIFEVLNTRRRIFGDDNSDTLQSIHNAGVLMKAKGDPARAETFLREALEGRLRVNGALHWSVAQTRQSLAELLISLKRFPEAETILLDAQRDTAAIEDPPIQKLIARARALAAFYEDWNAAEPHADRAAEAEHWRSERDTLLAKTQQEDPARHPE